MEVEVSEALIANILRVPIVSGGVADKSMHGDLGQDGQEYMSPTQVKFLSGAGAYLCLLECFVLLERPLNGMLE